MGAQTAIQWCDSTFNPWRGCARVHTGCAKCYAERMSKRNPGVLGVWGPNGTRVVAAEKTWSEPLKWDKAAAKAGERHRVFCASLADVFEDWQGPMVSSGGDRLFACVKCGHWGTSLLICEQCLDEDKWHLRQPVFMDDVRFKLFRMIDATPNLDWQLLTKRPENVTKMWPGGGFRKNVWLLTSVSDQQTADAMIPPLLQCRNLAPVLGLSMEPLVGPVNIWSKLGPCVWSGRDQETARGIDWVIVGGESGHGARPMHPQWAIDIRNQCQAAGVPFFYKQWGEWAPYYDVGAPFTEQEILGDKMAWVAIDGRWTTDQIKPDDFGDGTVLMSRVGKDAAGRELDGRTWDEFPKVSVTNG